MTMFNLAGGAVKAKTQLHGIRDAIAYYNFSGTAIPNPLTIYGKDYRILKDKAKVYLNKKGVSSQNITLFYGDIELRCDH